MEIKKDQLQTFKAWKAYMAIRLHFTGEYDYFKYKGTSTWGTIASMEKYFSKFEALFENCFRFAHPAEAFWRLGGLEARKD